MKHFATFFSAMPIAIAISGLLLTPAANADITISTLGCSPAAIFPWGTASFPSTPTYGQVVVAPGRILKEVTFEISNGNAIAIPYHAYVYAWTGTEITGPALYTSGALSVPPTGSNATFVPITVSGINAPVIPGNAYAVIFSTLGEVANVGNSYWRTSALACYVAPGAKFVYSNSHLFAGLFFPATPPWNNVGDFDNTSFRMVFGGLEVLTRYTSNLTAGDSVVNITNTGENGNNLYGPGYGHPVGNLCVNVYAFSPDEQLVSCCSCLVTPNGLVHLSANNDLVSNTLTGIRPDSLVIKLVATGTREKGSSCDNSAALAGTEAFQLAGGALAWGTTLHSASANEPPSGPFALTETPFLSATLSLADLASIRNRCTNIIGNGSTFGQCRSCRIGGLGGAKL